MLEQEHVENNETTGHNGEEKHEMVRYRSVQLEYGSFSCKINLPFISSLLEMQVKAEVHKLEKS